MPTTVLTYTAKSMDALLAQANTDLAPLLAHTFPSCSFDVRDDVYNKDYRLVITVETGGAVLPSPMVLTAFDAGSLQSSGQALQAYIAAHPTYFVSGPYVGNLSGNGGGAKVKRNPIIVATNVSAASGQAAWAPSSGGGGGTIGGAISAGQVAYGSAANTIAGSSSLLWNGSQFTIGSSTAGSANGLLIKGSGIADQAWAAIVNYDDIGEQDLYLQRYGFARVAGTNKNYVRQWVTDDPQQLLLFNSWGGISLIAYGDAGTGAGAQPIKFGNNTTEWVRFWQNGGVQVGGPYAASPGIGILTSANIKRGSGSPEGVTSGAVGDFFTDTAGGGLTNAPVLFVKTATLAANTGWNPVFNPNSPLTRFGRPIHFYDDFESFDNTTTSPSFSATWYVQTTGAGVTNTIINAGSRTTTEDGILKMITGTTSTGADCIMRGYNQNWDVTQGPFSLGFKIKIPAAPIVAEDYELQLGLLNDKALDASGIFFAYNIAQAQWMICHTGILTKQVTAVNVAVNTWTTLSIVGNLGATLTRFYVDGVLAGTLDCSGSVGQYAVGIRLVKIAGTTAAVVNVDTCYADLQNTRRAAWPNPV